MTEPGTRDAPAGRGPEELERLAATLKPAQRKVLAELASSGSDELTRAEYERIGIVSRSQAAYDLADLVQMGLLERVGSGRATRYRLAHPGAGRKRKWTDDRIRAELEEFCAGREDWPRGLEFKQENRADLYLAASRYGGIDYWAAELGYEEPDQRPKAPRTPVWRPAREQLRRAGRFAFAGAAGLILVLAAGLGLGSDEADPTPPTDAPAAAPSERLASAVAGTNGAPAQRRGLTLTLRASRGSSWVAVRRGSASGRVLYMGTLTQGGVARFRSGRFWIRLGAPWNLDGRLAGRALDFPGRMSTAIVRSGGLRVAEWVTPEPILDPPNVALLADQPGTASGAGGSAPPPGPPPPPPSPPPAPPQSGSARPSPDSPPAGPTPDTPPGQR